MLLMLPAFLLSLLAFLVDILLFVPHMQWGGWLVLAATILLAIGGVVTCLMRRALVSRKAHHKRIAENANLNEENYYNQQSMSPPGPIGVEPTALKVMGNPNPDKLPEFATFDVSQNHVDRPSQEERIPLNPRIPSNKLRDEEAMDMRTAPSGLDDGFRAPRRAGTESSFGSGRAYPESGEPQLQPQLPPPALGAVPGMRRNFSDPRVRDQQMNGTFMPSNPPTPSSVNSRGRGGYGINGRGGYGRGGYPGPWRGPFPQGIHGDGRGMGGGGNVGPPGPMGPPGGAGFGRGSPKGPPPDYSRGGYVPGGYGRGGAYSREHSPAGGFYGRRPSPGPPSAPAYRHGVSPGPSPPPPMPAEGLLIGQAVEMDARTGSPSPSQTSLAQGHPLVNEGAIQNTTGLTQDGQGDSRLHEKGGTSPTSVYSSSRPE